LLNSNTSPTCLYNNIVKTCGGGIAIIMVNFGPLTAEIGLPVCGTPAHFNGFRVLASLLQRVAHRRPTKLCTIFGRLLGWYTIYILGLRAKFTLRPSLAFSYISSVTARHSSSGPQPNFAAWYKEWNYGTFVEGATYIRLCGHHVGHRPTF